MIHIGDKDDTGVGSVDGRMAIEILDEFKRAFGGSLERGR